MNKNPRDQKKQWKLAVIFEDGVHLSCEKIDSLGNLTRKGRRFTFLRETPLAVLGVLCGCGCV